MPGRGRRSRQTGQYLFLDELHPVEYAGLERARHADGYAVLSVAVDDIAAIAYGAVNFPVRMGTVPHIAVLHIPEHHAELYMGSGHLRDPFTGYDAPALVYAAVCHEPADSCHIPCGQAQAPSRGDTARRLAVPFVFAWGLVHEKVELILLGRVGVRGVGRDAQRRKEILVGKVDALFAARILDNPRKYLYPKRGVTELARDAASPAQEVKGGDSPVGGGAYLFPRLRAELPRCGHGDEVAQKLIQM